MLALSGGVTLGQTARCLDMPKCEGCGCRGGLGYRGPDGLCVGFRELDRKCGIDRGNCKFENAANTGLNRDCVLGKRRLAKPES